MDIILSFHKLQRLLFLALSCPPRQVSVELIDGGMLTPCYTVLPEKGDKNDLVYVVNAAVEVGY